MSEKSKVYLALVANAMIIGLSFLFTQVALESAGVLDILAYRFFVAFVFCLIFVGMKWIRVEWKGKEKGIWKSLAVLALFYPTLFFSLQATGLLDATSAEGGILYATTPVLTMLLAAAVLKEKTTRLQNVSIVVSVVGVIFIFLMQGVRVEGSHARGVALLFLSCLAFAGYSVLGRKLTRSFRPIELSMLMMTIGFVVFTVAAVVRHVANGDLSNLFLPLQNIEFVLSILYLGMLSYFVTSILSMYTLSKLEAAKTSVFSNLSTLISIFAGAIFHQESVQLYHGIGTLLIVAGVLGTTMLGAAKTSAK